MENITFVSMSSLIGWHEKSANIRLWTGIFQKNLVSTLLSEFLKNDTFHISFLLHSFLQYFERYATSYASRFRWAWSCPAVAGMLRFIIFCYFTGFSFLVRRARIVVWFMCKHLLVSSTIFVLKIHIIYQYVKLLKKGK